MLWFKLGQRTDVLTSLDIRLLIVSSILNVSSWPLTNS